MSFERNKIVCGDALELLDKITEPTFNLIIADIPYFGIIGDTWDNQWTSLENYIDWLDILFAHFARVMKNAAACYVYSSITHYPHVQLCLNKHLAYSSTITWKKQRSRGNGWGFNREELCVNVKGDHVFKDVETQTLMLPHLRKGKLDYSNGKKTVRKRDFKLATAVWDDVSQTCSYRKQLHPTEKPVELARRILEGSSDEGDLILIPFAGSGSECEACIRLKRDFVAFEAQQHYCEIVRGRLAALSTPTFSANFSGLP